MLSDELHAAAHDKDGCPFYPPAVCPELVRISPILAAVERIATDAARTALREAAVRPYPEGTKLVVVSEGAWEEARLAECTIPELQDALANADGYAKGLPDRVADFLLGYSGDGDESDPQSWQSGHNYAMREAARMIRERWFDLPKPELPTPEDFGGAKC